MSDIPVKDEPVDASVPVADTVTPTQKLREKLFAFRFSDETTPSLRRSPRGHTPGRFAKFEEVDSELPTLPSAGPSLKKRSRTADVHVKSEDYGAPLKKARASRSSSPKKKREVAPPEKYAHLDPLSDHLGEGADMLDVMFCGINPGQMSATVGHHFAHPTNHFWRCLYGAGFTDRLLSASEDGTLPERFSLGMTNLVERPSAQAAELANTEYTAGVPALMQKIGERRPRIVCFVGKGIWDSFIRAAALPSLLPQTVTPSEVPGSGPESKTQVVTDSVTAESSKQLRPQLKKKSKSKTNLVSVAYDLQPYKVVHNDPNARVRETLFFVVVSTSGLVAGYQIPDKIKQFTLLKQRLDQLKDGSLDTTTMNVLPSCHVFRVST